MCSCKGPEYPIRPFRRPPLYTAESREPYLKSRLHTAQKVPGPVGFLGLDQSIDD